MRALLFALLLALPLAGCFEKDDSISDKVAAVIKGVQDQCDWLPATAGVVAVFHASAGMAASAVIDAICNQVEVARELAGDPGAAIHSLIQQAQDVPQVCIDVDGERVCIDEERG